MNLVSKTRALRRINTAGSLCLEYKARYNNNFGSNVIRVPSVFLRCYLDKRNSLALVEVTEEFASNKIKFEKTKHYSKLCDSVKA